LYRCRLWGWTFAPVIWRLRTGDSPVNRRESSWRGSSFSTMLPAASLRSVGANHNRLGFAVQLTTVRFLGTFLAEPTDVPSDAVAYVPAQLGIRDVACLADYAARPTTAWEHAAEIRRIYGYRDFTDPAESFRLVR
jgi:hypothetical protein